ncbi:MAG: tRNA (adenosine(37)-N6)-threonylcarbamoyltransferase complex ATPase subunit type 1 TsaE [Spirochaetaceae bacterium]
MTPRSSRSPQQTEEIAARFASTLRGGDVVTLHGGVGAGKTLFVRAVAGALGVSDRVVSPSFTLVVSYELPELAVQRTGARRLVHIDLYRMGFTEEVDLLGLEEHFASDTIALIEWPDRAEGLIPERHIRVELEITGADARGIHIDRPGD